MISSRVSAARRAAPRSWSRAQAAGGPRWPHHTVATNATAMLMLNFDGSLRLHHMDQPQHGTENAERAYSRQRFRDIGRRLRVLTARRFHFENLAGDFFCVGAVDRQPKRNLRGRIDRTSDFGLSAMRPSPRHCEHRMISARTASTGS